MRTKIFTTALATSLVALCALAVLGTPWLYVQPGRLAVIGALSLLLGRALQLSRGQRPALTLVPGESAPGKPARDEAPRRAA